MHTAPTQVRWPDTLEAALDMYDTFHVYPHVQLQDVARLLPEVCPAPGGTVPRGWTHAEPAHDPLTLRALALAWRRWALAAESTTPGARCLMRTWDEVLGRLESRCAKLGYEYP
jgi:hypothetical protein